MRRRLLVGGSVLLAVLAALVTPERDAAVGPTPGHTPFVWGQDDVWAQLEARFDAAEARGCDEGSAAIDAGLAGLDQTLASLEQTQPGPGADLWRTLEGQLFEVAPLTGACPERVVELAARVVRLRQAVEQARVSWDPASRTTRNTLYRLLYGSRAALEELLLQLPEPLRQEESLIVMAGTDVPSEAPSTEIRGVRLHSGDILVSRGGAPTSAMIARGNDYPGNFSHIALLHVSEAGTASVIESHIESGVGVTDGETYLADPKLRIMVMRLRAEHPALLDDPLMAHRAAEDALTAARASHIPYDFAMNTEDASKQFCSEVASAAYRGRGVRLWQGLSSFSSPGLTRWLSAFGVRHFETHGPSDLEYDPQLHVVAEYRDPDTLFDDHVDNAIIDAMLAGAESGDDVQYDRMQLPLARLAKAYSMTLNLFGAVGPIPEGMSATTGLRVAWLRERHGQIRDGLTPRIADFERAHGRRPAYWDLARLAREAETDLTPPGGA